MIDANGHRFLELTRLINAFKVRWSRIEEFLQTRPHNGDSNNDGAKDCYKSEELNEFAESNRTALDRIRSDTP